VNKSIFIILLLVLGCGLLAQTASPSTNAGGISAYTYDGARTGVEKLKMNVYVLGQIYKPGLYVVPDNTTVSPGIIMGSRFSSAVSMYFLRFTQIISGLSSTPLGRMMRILVSLASSLGPPAKASRVIKLVSSGTIFYAFTKVADFLSKAAIALSVYNLVTNLK